MGPKCHNMCTYCTSTLILSTLNLSVLNRTDMTSKTTVVQVLLINFRICNVFNLEICIFILTICHNEENSALGESRLWRVKNFSAEGKKSTVAGQQTASVEQSAVNGFAQGLSDGLLVEGIALVIYHPLLYFTDLARDSKGCGHNPPNTALITDPRHEVVK